MSDNTQTVRDLAKTLMDSSNLDAPVGVSFRGSELLSIKEIRDETNGDDGNEETQVVIVVE